MIRLLIYLSILVGCSLVFSWLADQTGQVTIQMADYQISTHPNAVIAGITLLTLSLILLLAIYHWIRYAPMRFREHSFRKRYQLGIDAMMQAVVAIATNNSKAANSFLKKAEKYISKQPLITLLHAQNAQNSGDHKQIEHYYQALLADTQTEMIAYKGLIHHAKSQGNLDEAIARARDLVDHHRKLGWAHEELVELLIEKRSFQAALSHMESYARVFRNNARKRSQLLAIIYKALANNAYQNGDYADSYQLSQKALPLIPADPELIHLAINVMKRLHYSTQKQLDVTYNAWKHQPHREFISLFFSIQEALPAPKVYKEAERWKKHHPSHSLSFLLMATAAHKLGKSDEMHRWLDQIPEDERHHRMMAFAQ